jgi:hypothetical protein
MCGHFLYYVPIRFLVRRRQQEQKIISRDSLRLVIILMTIYDTHSSLL